MSAPRVVITGTGRNGTGYTAALLTTAGLNAGHETYYGVGAPQNEALDVDCSWLALGHRLSPDQLMIHQRRDPLHIFSSFATKRWNTNPDEPYFARKLAIIPTDAYTQRGLPDPTHGSAIYRDQRRTRGVMAAVHVLELGALADQRSNQQIQLEHDWTPELIVRLASAAGRQIGLHDALAAINATPRTVNHHGNGHTIPPDELHHWIPGELAQELLELREHWNYR